MLPPKLQSWRLSHHYISCWKIKVTTHKGWGKLWRFIPLEWLIFGDFWCVFQYHIWAYLTHSFIRNLSSPGRPYKFLCLRSILQCRVRFRINFFPIKKINHDGTVLLFTTTDHNRPTTDPQWTTMEHNVGPKTCHF